MEVAAGQGRTQMAALLPDTDFGRQLGSDINAESARLSEPSPQIVFFDQSFNSVNQAVREVSDFSRAASRLKTRSARRGKLDTAAGREQARQLNTSRSRRRLSTPCSSAPPVPTRWRSLRHSCRITM